MSANFFQHNRIFVALLLAASLVWGICAWSILSLTEVERGRNSRSYYFLLSSEKNIEVGAEFAQFDGGAGYLLERDGAFLVVISAYEREEDGKAVQRALKKDGTETSLIQVGGNRLCFQGKEKKNAVLYENALRILEEYVSVLNNCISRLEKGMTQESCKRLLTILKRQFQYAAGAYEKYGEFSRFCYDVAKRLEEICQGTVFLKDLRYLLCWQVDKYAQFSAAFHYL